MVTWRCLYKVFTGSDNHVEISSTFRPDNEAKLLLWWGKVLELTVRQVHFNADPQAVLEALLAFTPALATLGEDKASSGLWGAIGLGKKSPLSHK